MSSVTFPPALGGDGSTVTDDPDPNTGLGNGGHRTRFVPSLYQAVAVMNGAVTQSAASQLAAETAIAASIWVSGGNYAIGVVRWSPSNFLNYRCVATANGRTTDPSADPSFWQLVGLPSPTGKAGQELANNGVVPSWGITAPGALAILNFIGY